MINKWEKKKKSIIMSTFPVDFFANVESLECQYGTKYIFNVKVCKSKSGDEITEYLSYHDKSNLCSGLGTVVEFKELSTIMYVPADPYYFGIVGEVRQKKVYKIEKLPEEILPFVNSIILPSCPLTNLVFVNLLQKHGQKVSKVRRDAGYKATYEALLRLEDIEKVTIANEEENIAAETSQNSLPDALRIITASLEKTDLESTFHGLNQHLEFIKAQINIAGVPQLSENFEDMLNIFEYRQDTMFQTLQNLTKVLDDSQLKDFDARFLASSVTKFFKMIKNDSCHIIVNIAKTFQGRVNLIELTSKLESEPTESDDVLEDNIPLEKIISRLKHLTKEFQTLAKTKYDQLLNFIKQKDRLNYTLRDLKTCSSLQTSLENAKLKSKIVIEEDYVSIDESVTETLNFAQKFSMKEDQTFKSYFEEAFENLDFSPWCSDNHYIELFDDLSFILKTDKLKLNEPTMTEKDKQIWENLHSLKTDIYCLTNLTFDSVPTVKDFPVKTIEIISGEGNDKRLKPFINIFNNKVKNFEEKKKEYLFQFHQSFKTAKTLLSPAISYLEKNNVSLTLQKLQYVKKDRLWQLFFSIPSFSTKITSDYLLAFTKIKYEPELKDLFLNFCQTVKVTLSGDRNEVMSDIQRLIIQDLLPEVRTTCQTILSNIQDEYNENERSWSRIIFTANDSSLEISKESINGKENGEMFTSTLDFFSRQYDLDTVARNVIPLYKGEIKDFCRVMDSERENNDAYVNLVNDLVWRQKITNHITELKVALCLSKLMLYRKSKKNYYKLLDLTNLVGNNGITKAKFHMMKLFEIYGKNINLPVDLAVELLLNPYYQPDFVPKFESIPLFLNQDSIFVVCQLQQFNNLFPNEIENLINTNFPIEVSLRQDTTEIVRFAQSITNEFNNVEFSDDDYDDDDMVLQCLATVNSSQLYSGKAILNETKYTQHNFTSKELESFHICGEESNKGQTFPNSTVLDESYDEEKDQATPLNEENQRKTVQEETPFPNFTVLHEEKHQAPPLNEENQRETAKKETSFPNSTVLHEEKAKEETPSYFSDQDSNDLSFLDEYSSSDLDEDKIIIEISDFIEILRIEKQANLIIQKLADINIIDDLESLLS